MKKLSLISSVMMFVFGSFSINARAATWYLQGYVANSNGWNDLSIWYSQPLGGGTNPTSISSSDNFDLNGYRVDTPYITSGTATFGGNELILHGGSGGLLVTKSTSPAVDVIPTLVSDGGTIANGTSATQSVDITTFTNNSNTTLSAESTRGLNFTIGTLSGSGDICAIGDGGGSAGGSILVNVTTATAFTGTLHIADGCQFTFSNAVTSGGALEVEGAGTAVTLNDTVTFKGLTVNGTAYAPGTYSVATLGAPFTGTGSVVVQAPAVQTYTVTPPFGVNLPGGSFSSGSFYPTDLNEWSYYQGKGLNLVRVAFLWERLQPTLNGSLSTTDLASLDAAVALAAARGMSVILDMHNYDRYSLTGVGGTSYVVGSTQVPYSAYQNVWQQLAAHFANEPGVYGYDIMNEPHGDSGTWDSTAAQYGVNGVRQSDTTHYVIVEGDDYAGAQDWMVNNANLNVTDSANKLIYSAHTYWDSNNSGTYSGTYDSNNEYPNIGVDEVAQFVYWLGLKGAKGCVGEFGVPNNVASPDYRWNNVLDNFLYYLNGNGVEATYWSGGECWGTTYALSCATGTPPVDAPAMSVLEQYGNIPTTSFVTGVSLEDLGTPSTNDWYGMQINVGATPITIAQLGRWVVSGNTGTHTVELVNASTGAVLGSVSVNTSGATPGAFKYVALATPVTLVANTSYYIASQETSGGDKWYYDETTVTPASVAAVPNSIYSANGTTWSANRTTNHCFGPVSFQYYFPVSDGFVTGESLSSLGTPNTNDWYGMQINVGATPITVTQLGRWVVSGNSGTHTVELVNASTGAVLGSVSVNTSGATAGAFKYVALAMPVTLAANTSYYIASQETSGGDEMYYDETAVTPASVATIPNSIYSANGATWSANRTTNHCFGPVSFVYQ